MNMFYTGLGIARSLGERGIPVIGLNAHPRAYGNYTRYARVKRAPDSRAQPEELLKFLLELAPALRAPAIIFPTRDDDVLFLDRFREELGRLYIPAIPGKVPLDICLDKWKTFLEAERTQIPAPRCWAIRSRAELEQILTSVVFPCVLKPQSAHHWRRSNVWELVGGRKAIPVSSPGQLVTEYKMISRVETRVLLQEMVAGGDDSLYVAACYFDRSGRFVAGFTAQKLLQVPAGFGTGCIVQTVYRPDLLEKARTLLGQIGFSGIAEVEFKKDSAASEYKLIEINPRPWDQHVLGKACGLDLIHLAYCDLAGLARPAIGTQRTGQKWVAEDVYGLVLLRAAVKRSGEFRRFLRLARGERVYPIQSLRDPLPFVALLVLGLVPDLSRLFVQWVRKCLGNSGKRPAEKEVRYGFETAKR